MTTFAFVMTIILEWHVLSVPLYVYLPMRIVFNDCSGVEYVGDDSCHELQIVIGLEWR
jgi:hypothetical protein